MYFSIVLGIYSVWYVLKKHYNTTALAFPVTDVALVTMQEAIGSWHPGEYTSVLISLLCGSGGWPFVENSGMCCGVLGALGRLILEGSWTTDGLVQCELPLWDDETGYKRREKINHF